MMHAAHAFMMHATHAPWPWHRWIAHMAWHDTHTSSLHIHTLGAHSSSEKIKRKNLGFGDLSSKLLLHTHVTHLIDVDSWMHAYIHAWMHAYLASYASMCVCVYVHAVDACIMGFYASVGWILTHT
jgi:hypothetical protein